MSIAVTPTVRRRLAASALLLAVTTGVAFAGPGAAAPPDRPTYKFGCLLQGRAEWEQLFESSPATGTYVAQNLYMRRVRLLLNGTVGPRLSFFLDTDSPNYGKASASGAKDFSDLYVQDAVATWRTSERFGVDTGLLLTPGAFNHLQSAASLLALDYGPYTFVSSSVAQERLGRDTGIQARGQLARRHVEYRIGAYQGRRTARADEPLRLAGRVAFSPLQTDGGMFYTGTSLGAAERLAFGLAADHQRELVSLHADVQAEHRLTSKLALTAQADLSDLDGRGALENLPDQTDWMVELGALIVPLRLTPFVQVARQELHAEGADETSVQSGAAWWLDGHRAAIKLGWTRILRDGAEARSRFAAQYQAFSF